MRQSTLILLFLLSGAPALAGEQSPTQADLAFFEARIRPLFAERCYACHSKSGKKQRGGLLLDSRTSFLKGGDSGPALIPGRPEESLLIRAVRYQHETLHMPPKGKLADREIALLEEWVRRGAAIPDAVASSPQPAANRQGARTFWSFQPPRLQQAPILKDHLKAQRRIDLFIQSEQEKRGLTPTSPASRQVLIRRAAFDLIGLPPTPEEIAAFVQGPAPDAYARLIERLLASPQYGERWARFWLDLARYCDVAESWMESKGQPYLYRDWVVRAFNEDLPYDQFVQRQLAADLMPEARPEDRAALGFLGLSPSYWKELKLDKEVIKTVVAEEWEERIQAVTSTFLGLTVACARCHDHKFDPITQNDYYALAGVFASIRQVDRPLLPDHLAVPVQQAHSRIQSVQEKIDKLKAQKPPPADAMKQLSDLRGQIEQVRKTTPQVDAPRVPGVEEASLYVLADGPHRTKLEYKPGVAQDVAIQVRGNPSNIGPVVPRRFLDVLSSASSRPFHQGSGRRELAQAIVSEGAPLAARVLVNRIWKHHFGAGLVETPSDFGAQGSRPSHPELLDDLTARFLANGWSIKWLHREIMLSATYQQSSIAEDRRSGASPESVDPDNRWLWRMNRRRLEVEAWRDAMLAVTGALRLEPGGPPMDLGDSRNQRRTLYGTVKRRELSDLLRLNDFPDPTAHSPARLPTTTPLQQLFVLNSPFIEQQAAALVSRLKRDAPCRTEEKIHRAYLLLYGRAPTERQTDLAIDFLTQGRREKITDAMWQQYAQALLASNEFLFID
jgi:hypothetical protein